MFFFVFSLHTEVIWAQLVRDSQVRHGLKEGKTYVLVKQSKRWRCAKLCEANLRQSCSRRAALSGAPPTPSNNATRELENAKRITVFHNTLSCQRTHPLHGLHGGFIIPTGTSVRWTGVPPHTYTHSCYFGLLFSDQQGLCMSINLTGRGHMGNGCLPWNKSRCSK